MRADEKVLDELYDLGVFFSKTHTKRTLFQTIRKAEMLIRKIEAEIKRGKIQQTVHSSVTKNAWRL
jgi:hypothetical protein